VNNLVELFVEHLRGERNLSKNTVDSYVLDLEDYGNHVDLNGKIKESA
jgi:site-specific recombinase XerD